MQQYLPHAMLVTALLAVPSTRQAPPRDGGAAKDPTKPRIVVLAGCLVASDANSGAPFLLLNASPAPTPLPGSAEGPPTTGSTGVGTTGTGTSGSGTTPTPVTAQDSAHVTFALEEPRGTGLRRHVNRRVEIRGTPLARTDASAPEGPPRLQVERVRRLGGACSRGK